MHGATSVLQMVLFTAIASAILFVTIPWAMDTIGISMDTSELNSIKAQFDTCNDRILETARTGATNKCVFSVTRGQIYGRTEGVYYSLTSEGPICDRSFLREIDARTHVWQECNVTGDTRVYGMLWMFPKNVNVTVTGLSGSVYNGTATDDIDFEEGVTFRTLTLSVAFQYKSDIAGKTVRISRVNITNTNVTLRLDIEE
jgi:hypothetical protein